MTKRRKTIATENREPFLSIGFTLMSATLLVEKVKHQQFPMAMQPIDNNRN